MLLVDLDKGKIVQDNDLKKQMYGKLDYSKIVKENIVTLKEEVSLKNFRLENENKTFLGILKKILNF